MNPGQWQPPIQDQASSKNSGVQTRVARENTKLQCSNKASLHGLSAIRQLSMVAFEAWSLTGAPGCRFLELVKRFFRAASARQTKCKSARDALAPCGSNRRRAPPRNASGQTTSALPACAVAFACGSESVSFPGQVPVESCSCAQSGEVGQTNTGGPGFFVRFAVGGSRLKIRLEVANKTLSQVRVVLLSCAA